MTLPLGFAWFDNLSAYPLLLLVVVLAARLLALPATYHPLTLYCFFVQQLAKKVNPDPSRPAQQLYISGSLALLVAWLPAMALAYSLYRFSDLPLVLDALLLFFSLDWHNQRQQAIVVQQSLQRGQLTLAREQAKVLLCRRTASLSEMGLSKAVLESLTLRSASQFIGVLCWFLLAGGLAALGYRLLLELQQQWNPKRAAFRCFGRPSSVLAEPLSALPKLISCSLIALQYGVLRCYRQCRQQRQHINRFSFWLLCCTSVALRRSLGGPLYYDDWKLQRSKIIQATEPGAADISVAVKLLQFTHLFCLLLIASSSLLQLTWQLTH
jgi:adenosylcobinamide-phosphate synthase